MLNILDPHGVNLAVVTSTPSREALKLYQLDSDRIVPFFTHYITGRNRLNWFYDNRVLPQARVALVSGKFFGLVQFTCIAAWGHGVTIKNFQGLLSLAQLSDELHKKLPHENAEQFLRRSD